MELRPYQRAAVDAMWNFLAHRDGNPLWVLPTASGKSVVQAAFLRQALEQYPRARVMLLSHVKELLQQNGEKLHAYWPSASIGFYCAGLKRRDAGYQTTIASIQSVFRKASLFKDVSLIIIDECHLVPARGEGMYRSFLADMVEHEPRLRIIGMSATH